MIAFASLVVRETKAAILAKCLQVAQSVGLPVTSWQIGDPTETLLQSLAELFDGWEQLLSDWIASASLDEAAAETRLYGWLVIAAYQGFGYVARPAGYAQTTVTLSNAGGGYYPIDAGALSFKNTSTGATYHNTSAAILASGPGTTVDVDVIADEPGSASSAGPADIDALVSTLLGVTCSNTIAAVGTDAEPASSIVAGCRNKLSAMSPNGPRAAYVYVATNAELTGTTAVTMARSVGDSATGDVTVLVAGPNMPITAPDLALVEATIVQNCTPLCITPAVTSATAVVLNVEYAAFGYASWGVTTAEAHTAIEAAIRAWFVAQPIGGDIVPPATAGVITVARIEAAGVSANAAKITSLVVTLPAGSTMLGATQKPVCGTVTATAPFHFIPDP